MHIQQTHFYIYTQQVLNQLNRDSEKNPFLLAVESILGAQPEKICLFGSILLFPTVISNLHKSIVAYVHCTYTAAAVVQSGTFILGQDIIFGTFGPQAHFLKISKFQLSISCTYFVLSKL